MKVEAELELGFLFYSFFFLALRLRQKCLQGYV